MGSVGWKNELLKGEREKINKLKIIKMEVISKEEYLKVHYGDRKEYFRLFESKLKPMKFSIGDVIHTIDYHYLEDGDGNDITVTKFETGKRYILNLLIDNTTLIYPLNFVVDDWTGVDVNLKI